MRGARGWYDLRHSCPLDFNQGAGIDGLDFRYDDVRPLPHYQATQCLAIRHIDDMGAVGNLLARRVGITIHCDSFDAETLQGNDDLLAEFATTQQHHSNSGVTE